MRMSMIASVLPLLALGACRCTSSAALSPDDVAAIEATKDAWVSGVRAKDWKAVSVVYAPDAVLMPPNQPAVSGREAIRAWFAVFPPITAVELHPVEIDGRGDVAFVRGTYKLTLAPPGIAPIHDQGKFIEIHRRQPDGSWPISSDIFNSDLPAN